jgi:hypothetical protein
MEWQGHRTKHGYGRAKYEGKYVVASRLVLMLGGEDMTGKFACHKCDNPPCINPDHLYAGTPSDNAFDYWSRGRKLTKKLMEDDEAGGMGIRLMELEKQKSTLIRALMKALGALLRQHKYVVLR